MKDRHAAPESDPGINPTVWPGRWQVPSCNPSGAMPIIETGEISATLDDTSRRAVTTCARGQRTLANGTADGPQAVVVLPGFRLPDTIFI